jgi:RimJ/RimL family protein N-acetyltransferase
MAKKKRRRKHPNRPSKTLKRETQLLKAAQWLPTYGGTKIVKAYKKRFCVDVNSAVRDLLELGYEFQPGYVDNLLKSETARLEQMNAQKEERRRRENAIDRQDNGFAYVAGYTSGGAPYGVTWDEMAQIRVRDARKRLPPIPVPFSELDGKEKAEALVRLEELIGEYFGCSEYLPDDGDMDEILTNLCDELTESLDRRDYDTTDRDDLSEETDAEDDDGNDRPEIEPFREIMADDALKAAFDGIVSRFVGELRAEGIELVTFADSLFVTETERLIIRQFCANDLDALWAIMKKTEVMYAWGAGFHKREVRKWLNHQTARYRDDGYGYFAVTLKKGGKLIGQAGLMKSEVNGEQATEIGYIFNNRFWGRGYAVEAAHACVGLAFNEFGLEKLYATIRPENTASAKVAVKLGMRKTGSHVKIYNDKEMPHDIYLLER